MCPVPRPAEGEGMGLTPDNCTCTHAPFSRLDKVRLHFFYEHWDFAVWDLKHPKVRTQKITNGPRLRCVCNRMFEDVEKLDVHVMEGGCAPYRFNLLQVTVTKERGKKEDKPRKTYTSSKRRPKEIQENTEQLLVPSTDV